MPLTGPHTPWLPSNESKGKSGAGLYGDFVMDIDQVVARISSKLEAEGLLDNTLIILVAIMGLTGLLRKFFYMGMIPIKGVGGKREMCGMVAIGFL